MAINLLNDMAEKPPSPRVPLMIRLLCKLPAAALLVLTALLLDSCTGTKSGTGQLPKNLPAIALNSSPATPPHSLPSYSYPFDSRGNYVSDWAAEGERKAGRTAATSSDVEKWRSSHGGSASRSKPKVASSSRSSSSGTRKKTSSGSKTASSGRSYSVKKGDTLSAIARRNGTTVAKLKAANGLSSDNIGIGKVLKVPRA